MGFNPPLVEDDPFTGDCKVWSGGRIRPPPGKVKNPNSSLIRSKLMSNIIQTHLQKLFCNGL